MVILQALLALISRSLGSIMSALFGWAVVALFGPTTPREKMWLSALVGAAAASFFIVFIMVPVRRLVSIARREVDLNVPLITDAKGYEVVAKVIAVTLSRHGLDVQPAEPEWTATAPSRILSLFGGLSFREYVPERFARFRGPRLDVMLYPNGLLLR